MNVVLDANLIAALVLPLPYSEAAAARILEWKRRGTALGAPALWSYEVGTVLRRAVAAGILPAERLDFALEQLWRINIRSVLDSQDLQRRALAWAERLGQSKAYGGAYLAAAEALGAEFWTADQGLAHAAGVAWVRLIDGG